MRYKATDQSGNSSYSQTRNINIESASDLLCNSGSAVGLKNVAVYPNPSEGSIIINANLHSTQNLQISISNAVGQQIKSINQSFLRQNYLTIDLTKQAASIYFMTLKYGGEVVVKKIVIR